MSDPRQLAEAVRKACLQTALEAYEGAGISGLCGEGRWEIAVQALRGLDLGPIVDRFRGDAGDAAQEGADQILPET